MVVRDEGTWLAVGELRTGRIHAYLPYASIKYGARLNAHGPMSATLRPFSRELAGYDIRSLTATVKQFMAIGRGDRILEAGPIWTRPFDEDTGQLVINGTGLWSVFDRRKNVNGAMLLPGAKVTEDRITVADAHPGSVARELVRISLEDNPYGGDLPVALPPHIAVPGAEPRVYNGYNLSWLGDDLRALVKEEGGPDLRFRPRFKAGDDQFIEWSMEHGDPLLTQAGPDWTWDVRVERSGVAKLGLSQDGTGLGAMAWTPGSGQEESMRLATQRDTTLVDAGYPWTEVEEAATDEESQAILQALADRKLADALAPWDTWAMTVRADVEPFLGEYLPGDWAVVNTPERHPVLPAGGKVRVRILAVDGDGTNEVSMAVAPIQGVDGSATDTVTIADPNATPVVLPLLAGPGLLTSPTLLLTS